MTHYLISPLVIYAEHFLICSLCLFEQRRKRNGERWVGEERALKQLTPSPLGVTRMFELILGQVHQSNEESRPLLKGPYQQKCQCIPVGMGAEESGKVIFPQ